MRPTPPGPATEVARKFAHLRSRQNVIAGFPLAGSQRPNVEVGHRVETKLQPEQASADVPELVQRSTLVSAKSKIGNVRPMMPTPSSRHS